MHDKHQIKLLKTLNDRERQVRESFSERLTRDERRFTLYRYIAALLMTLGIITWWKC